MKSEGGFGVSRSAKRPLLSWCDSMSHHSPIVGFGRHQIPRRREEKAAKSYARFFSITSQILAATSGPPRRAMARMPVGQVTLISVRLPSITSMPTNTRPRSRSAGRGADLALAGGKLGRLRRAMLSTPRFLDKECYFVLDLLKAGQSYR